MWFTYSFYINTKYNNPLFADSFTIVYQQEILYFVHIVGVGGTAVALEWLSRERRQQLDNENGSKRCCYEDFACGRCDLHDGVFQEAGKIQDDAQSSGK